MPIHDDTTASRSPWWVTFVLLHLGERLALVGLTLVVVGGASPSTTVLFGGLFATLAAARGFFRGTLYVRSQASLHARAIDALFGGELLRPNPLDSEDAEAAILEGITCGARLSSELGPQLLADTIASLALTVFFVARESAAVVAVGGTAVLLGGAAVFGVRRVTVHEAEGEWEAYGPVVDGLVTTIAARLEIVGNGSEGAFRRAFADDLRSWSRSSLRAQRLFSVAGRVPLLIGGGVVGAALLVQTSLRGETMASAMAHAALFASALPAFAGVFSGLHESAKARVRFRPLAQLLQTHAARPSFGGTTIPSLHAAITWDAVSFSYPRAVHAALAHVDVLWDADAILILAGANGSGKSTLLRLLLGVTPAYDGKICIGGAELTEVDLAAWRDAIGYLPQRPYLSDRATVEASFVLTAPGASKDRRREMLERLGLWTVLASKSPSDPFSTKVGMLSTGERQRLALARLFAADKPILLLDEPDANLDAEGIKLVSSLIRELSATRRIAIAAHTSELLALGGVIVTIAQGRVESTTRGDAICP